MAAQQQRGFLDRFFKLTEHKTNVRTEIVAGLTTFVTMAYIIIVNPLTLADAGLDFGAVFMATILAAAASTLVMGLYANWPLALAPGMGLNAFFAYGMVGFMGIPWQTALGAVLISGVLMMIITLTGLRQVIIGAIPGSLKHAVGAGIGLFILLIGLKNAGIVVPYEATIITLGPVTERPVLLAIIGLIITAALVVRRVPGGILIGMLVTTVLGIPFGVTVMPERFISTPPSMLPTFLQLDILGALKLSMIPVIFSLFFADMFDTLGTFMGVAGKADLIDKDGNLKGDKKALFADAAGTMVGAAFGTSNTTTYVESAAGISAGGRTGLTAVVTATLFLLAMFFSDIALAIPKEATAAALIIVGVLMSSALLRIDLDDFTVAFPAVITALMMPFTFSIATGLALGFVSYVAINLLAGRYKQIHWMMYVLTLFFVYYFYTH